MISASVGVNSSLLLEPAQTLTFALDAASAVATRACLTLTNISPRKHVVFKVRTTNVEMFLVKPAQGVIAPSGDVPVVITLLAPACERLLRMAPQERAALIERFLIQSIDRAEDMLGFGVDDLAAFWKRLPKELITNKKLTCRFIETRDGEPTVHVPLHRMQITAPYEPTAHVPAFVKPQQQQPPSPPPPPPRQQPQAVPPRSPAKAQLAPTQTPRETPVRPSAKHDRPAPVPTVAPTTKPSRALPLPRQTPPMAMNMPSSPVPSLRPKQVFPQITNNHSSHHSSSSSHSNSSHDGQGGHDDDLATGVSNISSNDSYATNRVAQMQFDEHIQSDDVLEYRLHPSESLLFPVHHAYPNDSPTGIVEGKSYFFITNKARHSGLAFKIKTSNHTGYFVKPARGLINAKSAQRIDVFVNAPDASRFDAQDREMKDRFLVELLFVGPAKSAELLALPEERKRQDLQRVWEQSKSADRRQAVLSCQILEEDSPVDPSHQTAEQARALLLKSQVATTLSFNNNNSVPLDTSGATANPWVHRPTSPAMHTPRSDNNQYQQQYAEYASYQQAPPQVRSPVMQQVRSPVMQQPRSPVMQQPRSPVKQQPRSPVRPLQAYHSQQQPQQQPLQPQQYYGGGGGAPLRNQRAALDS